MLRTATAALAVALVISPIGFSAFPIAQNNATAGATLRTAMLMSGKMRTFSSGSEFRVCNEGAAPVRMFASNSLTGISTESLVEPGRCAQSVGTMMSFKNENRVPVMLYAFGGMGGRPGRGPGQLPGSNPTILTTFETKAEAAARIAGYERRRTDPTGIEH
jgi:hypothetical protein